MVSHPFSEPQTGASLLLAFHLKRSTVVVVGSNSVAAARVFSAIEADATVLILANNGLNAACPEILHRVQTGQATFLDLDALLKRHSEVDRVIEDLIEKHASISLLCVTDTLLEGDPLRRRSFDSAQEICIACRQHRIPINVTDIPSLCDFTFPTSHRFINSCTNARTPLQIAIATNGQGCRLGGRIKRDIISRLHKDVGVAVEKVGKLRDLSRLAHSAETLEYSSQAYQQATSSSTPNYPLPPPPKMCEESLLQKAQRRMHWVAQISEYWPLDELANLTKIDMEKVLDDRTRTLSLCRTLDSQLSSPPPEPSPHALQQLHYPSMRKGKIYLVGSGIGHPSLLTVATRNLLIQHATLVLADKLVPSEILEILPKHVKLYIARKFPGNAEEAQTELMTMAVDAAARGEMVIRLKQGDPMVYGRAGEEILFFRSQGFEPTVIPGLSSAIAGPLLAGIPVTQRGVSESFVVCTGIGRNGMEVSIPGYRREQTTVILMGVARISNILKALLEEGSSRRQGAVYPTCLPIAIIERASMPDQRIVVSTLSSIQDALDSIGAQRPPGMLIIGWSVLALDGSGDTTVLQEDAYRFDEKRIDKWLGSSSWKVVEGLSTTWDSL